MSNHARSNQALTLLAPESWKSARSQNVSQTVSNGVIWSEKVKSCFYSIGSGILEVCEKSKRLADRFKWSYRISECQMMLILLYWHRNPGSL